MKQRDKLNLWQERLRDAQGAAQEELEQMAERESLYAGTHQILSGGKQASVVRNIVAEIIEAQVDSAVPIPKVTARHRRHEELAKRVEDYLKGELLRLPMWELNDMDERTTYLQGGDFALVEWDESGGSRCEQGELALRLLHPSQLIAQPGVTAVGEMDYFFVVLTCTRESVRRRFGVDVTNESACDGAHPHLVTMIQTYYKNETGGIGLFSFVGDTVLQDLPDYQSRLHRVCVDCGEELTADGPCPICGGAGRWQEAQEQVLREDIVRADGSVIPAVGEDGASTRLPYYRPGEYPLAVRKNVSVYGRLLGDSDCDKVRDSQEAIKMTATKIQEKLFKGGSYVTLPEGKTIRRTDEELKVIEVENPAEMAMISVINLQPDVSRDLQYLDYHYQAARDVIGITDSFQGRRDATAVSGKAKEVAAAQSAGRLESKRTMKNAFYAQLFRLMFRFALAYADEPRPVLRRRADGTTEYEQFSRYDFLEKDEKGEWYFIDEFEFSVDSASTPVGNRQAMWKETLSALQSGAFGAPNELETLIAYWSRMDEMHYPGAKENREMLEKRLAEKKQPAAGGTATGTPTAGAPTDPAQTSGKRSLTGKGAAGVGA